MNLKKKLEKLPKGVRELIKTISACEKKNNFRVYLVGGIVRDLILGRANFDLDIVVEDDAIEFAKILSGFLGTDFKCHLNFKTATVLSIPFKIDLATSRREVYKHWGALPFVEVSGLRDDLRRRDFTINAIALSLAGGSFGDIVDYFGGIADLNKGIIRILHDKSFLDDPTRLFRAIRFKERFGFRFDAFTSRCFRQAVSLKALEFVHIHRLRDELVLILQEQKPGKYIKSLQRNIGLNLLGIQTKDRRLYALLRRIEKVIPRLKGFFPGGCINEWLLYFMALYRYTPLKKLQVFLPQFGLKKQDVLGILNSKKISVISGISRRLDPSGIYRLLNPFRAETIIFFYAAASSSLARRNIEDYLLEYRKVELKIKGTDLKALGIYPETGFGKILKKLLYKKINGKMPDKEDEIEQAMRLHKRMALASGNRVSKLV